MLVGLVLAMQIMIILNKMKKMAEEAQMAIKSTQLLRKSLAAGAFMIAGKVIKTLKKKFEGGDKHG